ncbi:MAG: arginase family protein [Acidobacteriota bacterium]
MYRLLPTASTARLGEVCYLYDENARQAPIVSIPTQKVGVAVHAVVCRLKDVAVDGCRRSLAELRALFSDAAELRAFDKLVERGYIEEVPSLPDGHTPASSGEAPAMALDGAVAVLREGFLRTDVKHFFTPPRLFNLPREIDDDKVEVGFVGVPFASNPQSVGTEFTPNYLRTLTQRRGFWFDIHRNGMYSEVGLERGLPAILARGVMLQDYGDFGLDIRTVGDLFREARGFVAEAVRRDIRMIYAGGDHAITFPIVDAYLTHFPKLCLLHLDAHNDLFFTDRITYNHVAPISNLLLGSNLQRVYSFGLRTDADSRVNAVVRLTEAWGLGDRLRLHSLAALRRLVAERDGVDRLRKEIGGETPCYLTIDLDVLSASAVGGGLSTPAGPGLEWWDLLEVVRLLIGRFNVVACDLVELNVPAKSAPDPERYALVTLLLLLIDGLARRPRLLG